MLHYEAELEHLSDTNSKERTITSKTNLAVGETPEPLFGFYSLFTNELLSGWTEHQASLSELTVYCITTVTTLFCIESRSLPFSK